MEDKIEQEVTENFNFKIALLGDPCVGKTSIAVRLTQSNFEKRLDCPQVSTARIHVLGQTIMKIYGVLTNDSNLVIRIANELRNCLSQHYHLSMLELALSRSMKLGNFFIVMTQLKANYWSGFLH